MGLILPIVFLGLMASLSPATIVVFVLVLGTARASVNALGFLIGWGLSLTLVFQIVDDDSARSGSARSLLLAAVPRPSDSHVVVHTVTSSALCRHRGEAHAQLEALEDCVMRPGPPASAVAGRWWKAS